MQGAGRIVVCFAVIALGCGTDDKPAETPAVHEAKTGDPKRPARPTAQTYHVEWQRCAAYFNARDERKLAECFPSGSELVIAGHQPITGSGILELHKQLWTGFANYSLDSQASWVSGNTAAILAIVGGTQTGEYQGAPATGKTARQLALYVLDLGNDWRIKRATLYTDEALAARQLGRLPATVPVRPPADSPFAFRDNIASAGDDVESAAAAHVASYEAALNARDMAALAALFSDDATLYHPSLSGAVQGRDQVQKTYETLLARVSNAKQTTTRTLSAGGWVIVEHTFAGTMSGVALTVPAATLFHVENGRIRGVWLFENTMPALEKIAAATTATTGSPQPSP